MYLFSDGRCRMRNVVRFTQYENRSLPSSDISGHSPLVITRHSNCHDVQRLLYHCHELREIHSDLPLVSAAWLLLHHPSQFQVRITCHYSRHYLLMRPADEKKVCQKEGESKLCSDCSFIPFSIKLSSRILVVPYQQIQDYITLRLLLHSCGQWKLRHLLEKRYGMDGMAASIDRPRDSFFYLPTQMHSMNILQVLYHSHHWNTRLFLCAKVLWITNIRCLHYRPGENTR